LFQAAFGERIRLDSLQSRSWREDDIRQQAALPEAATADDLDRHWDGNAPKARPAERALVQRMEQTIRRKDDVSKKLALGKRARPEKFKPRRKHKALEDRVHERTLVYAVQM
jgi:hypothetical protein